MFVAIDNALRAVRDRPYRESDDPETLRATRISLALPIRRTFLREREGALARVVGADQPSIARAYGFSSTRRIDT